MNIKFDPEIHHRSSIRLKGFDYSQAGGYYLTIVTYRRDVLFGDVVGGKMQANAMGKIVQECWGEIPTHFPNAGVDVFTVMPNHVHGILFIYENNRAVTNSLPLEGPRTRRGTIYRAPTPKIEQFGKPMAGSLPTVVRTFKAAVTRRAGRKLNSSNIWQRNYYDHIIRDQADYERIVSYILDNPLNWDQDEENPLSL